MRRIKLSELVMDDYFIHQNNECQVEGIEGDFVYFHVANGDWEGVFDLKRKTMKVLETNVAKAIEMDAFLVKRADPSTIAKAEAKLKKKKDKVAKATLELEELKAYPSDEQWMSAFEQFRGEQ